MELEGLTYPLLPSVATLPSVPRVVSVCEFQPLGADIEERLAALLDCQHQGLEAKKLCRTAADREFTKRVMDDLKQQIRSLREKLKASGTERKPPRRFQPARRKCKLS